VRLVDEASDGSHAYHLLIARVPARDRVRRRLSNRGIETGLHYPVPCHQMLPYQGYARGPLPVAERAAHEIVSLPLFPHMTAEQVAVVCKELHDAVVAKAGPDVG